MTALADKLRALAAEVEAFELSVPTPPPPSGGELTLELIASDASAVSTTPGQKVAVLLAGSGASSAHIASGDQYKVTFAGSLADPFGNTMLASVRRSSSGIPVVTIIDRAYYSATQYVETYYNGWTAGDGVLNQYTRRRLLALIAALKPRYPQLDWSKLGIYGGSMGAWGSAQIGVRNAQLFAYAYPSRPRWRSAFTVGTVDVPEIGGNSKRYPAASAPVLSAVDGGGSSAAYFDLIGYVADKANAVPFVGWSCGLLENFVPWNENLEAIAAFRLAKRPFAFAWANADHGWNRLGVSVADPLTAIEATYGHDFKIGGGFPYFSNSSRDQVPPTKQADGTFTSSDLDGAINAGFSVRNIVETAAGFSCEIQNKLGPTTVTVEPSSRVFTKAVEPQTITCDAVTWTKVSFTADVIVEPPPPPPPPPPPLPPSNGLAVMQAVNPAKLVCFKDYFAGGQAYDRQQRITVMRGASWTATIVGLFGVAPKQGHPRPFEKASYALLVDGVEAARFTVTPGVSVASATLPLAQIAEGWHRLEIKPDDAGDESCLPWFAYRQVGAAPVPQETMPVVMGSYDLYRSHYTYAGYAMVPAVSAPKAIQYVQRETPHFSEALPRTALIATEVAPWQTRDIYRPRVTEGIVNTANLQSYYFDSIENPRSKLPTFPLLDGPRGVGTAGAITHVQPGVSLNGSLYCTDSWRAFNISPNGTVRTLVGWRHKAAPVHRPAGVNNMPQSAEGLELVGDWSAIPPERRGVMGLWGFAFLPSSLVVDTTTTPIPNDGNGGLLQQQHSDPVFFLFDAQAGRVLRCQGSRLSHNTPFKVTEFITGLQDCWDGVCGQDDRLYISERKAHRISVFDGKTGARIETLVEGRPLVQIEQNRWVTRLAPEAEIQAEPCVAPEGLYYLDGCIYWGSIGQGQVRKIDLQTREVSVVATAPLFSRGGTLFLKIAVSDGTFGPRGTVFGCDWLDFDLGHPWAVLPDGSRWRYAAVAENAPGRPWETRGYRSAVGVGQGRLVFGTSAEGIVSISKALPSDPIMSATRWATISDTYRRLGLHLTHGPQGNSPYGLPTPWGVHPDADEYLTAYGHERAA